MPKALHHICTCKAGTTGLKTFGQIFSLWRLVILTLHISPSLFLHAKSLQIDGAAIPLPTVLHYGRPDYRNRGRVSAGPASSRQKGGFHCDLLLPFIPAGSFNGNAGMLTRGETGKASLTIRPQTLAPSSHRDVTSGCP